MIGACLLGLWGALAADALRWLRSGVAMSPYSLIVLVAGVVAKWWAVAYVRRPLEPDPRDPPGIDF